MAARQYRHEEIAAVPRGWRVRTIPQKGHLVRVAFPPGPRKKGAGKVISILHPVRENPAACNPEGLHLSLCVDPQANPIYLGNVARRTFRVWFKDGSATLIEAKDRAEARKFAQRDYREGPIEAIDDLGALPRSRFIRGRSNPRRQLSVPEQHQLKIARDTLRMPDAMVPVMGGMDKPTARRVIRELTGRSPKENPLLEALVGGAAAGAAVVGSQEAIKKIRERKGKGMWPFRRSNQNNDKQAHQLYRDFHGRGPSEVLALTESILADSTYVALGDNPEIWLGPVSGVDPINWRQADLALDPEDQVKVASDAEGTQFYFVRGNQALPRQVLDRLAGAGIDIRKRFLDLGQVYALSYQTEKKFDGFKTIPYAHRFGKNNEGRPMLVYDQETKKLLLVGGVYSIAPYDSSLGASPGVVH